MRNLIASTLILAAVTLAGCAHFMGDERFESDRAKLATLIEDEYVAFTYTVGTLTQLHAAGVVSREDLLPIRGSVTIWKRTLDEATAKLEIGDVQGARASLDLLARLKTHVQGALNEHLAPPQPEQPDGPSHDPDLGEHRHIDDLRGRAAHQAVA